MNREQQFKKIAEQLLNLFLKKNHDYGDDYFTGGYTAQERWLSVKRKVSRLEAFYKQGKLEIADETVADTWKDLAIYSIMELMKMEIDKNDKKNK